MVSYCCDVSHFYDCSSAPHKRYSRLGLKMRLLLNPSLQHPLLIRRSVQSDNITVLTVHNETALTVEFDEEFKSLIYVGMTFDPPIKSTVTVSYVYIWTVTILIIVGLYSTTVILSH